MLDNLFIFSSTAFDPNTSKNRFGLLSQPDAFTSWRFSTKKDILPVLDQGYDLWVSLPDDALSVYFHNPIPWTDVKEEITIKNSCQKNNLN